jgi:hypothetical protein
VNERPGGGAGGRRLAGGYDDALEAFSIVDQLHEPDGLVVGQLAEVVAECNAGETVGEVIVEKGAAVVGESDGSVGSMHDRFDFQAVDACRLAGLLGGGVQEVGGILSDVSFGIHAVEETEHVVQGGACVAAQLVEVGTSCAAEAVADVLDADDVGCCCEG